MLLNQIDSLKNLNLIVSLENLKLIKSRESYNIDCPRFLDIRNEDKMSFYLVQFAVGHGKNEVKEHQHSGISALKEP